MGTLNSISENRRQFEELAKGQPYALITPHIGSMVVVYLGNIEAPEGSIIPCHGLQYGGAHGKRAAGARTGERHPAGNARAIFNPLSELVGRTIASEAQLAAQIHALGYPVYRGDLLDAAPRRVH